MIALIAMYLSAAINAITLRLTCVLYRLAGAKKTGEMPTTSA